MAASSSIITPGTHSVHWDSVFCDIDGTLISTRLQILPETLAAIQYLGKNGIPFTIASARGPRSVGLLTAEYDIRASVITYSGGQIFDEKGNVLWQKGMTRDDAEKIIRFAPLTGIDSIWSVFVPGAWITQDASDRRITDDEEVVKVQAVQGRIEDIPAETPVFRIVFFTEDKESGDSLALLLKKEFPDSHVTKSWVNMVEVMEGSVTKAGAVVRLCHLLGKKPENAVAFGDNYNDEEMLRAVGHGVLMANGPEDLKKRIQFITEDNDHEGIANELQRIGLIP
jgi:Cof subfamily protein (haloacid dehalogenase superfamily)